MTTPDTIDRTHERFVIDYGNPEHHIPARMVDVDELADDALVVPVCMTARKASISRELRGLDMAIRSCSGWLAMYIFSV